jgi:ATP-dependent protease ClpP protease subunit
MQKFTKEILNKSPTQSQYSRYEPAEFQVSFVPNKGGVWLIEITDDIEAVDQFSTAIHALGLAKEDDEVEITLQCNGGSVDATDALIHAMRKCQAPIHILASGGCHSAASMILLEGDSFELSDGFNALLHCGQNGAGGGVNEYMAKSTFDAEFRTRKFKEAYEGFLSPDEIDNMLKGQDIWLDNKMWYERSLVRMEYFQKKQADFEADQQAAIVAKMEEDIAHQKIKDAVKAVKKERKTVVAHVA